MAPLPASHPRTPESAQPSADQREDLVVRIPSQDERVAESKEEKVEGNTSSGESAAPTKEFEEGGYGWVVVASVATINAHSWGVNAAYAIFLAYYLRNDAFKGATPLAYAFVGGLSLSIALLFSPIATISIRKFGTRITLWIGVVFETAAFVGASFTSEIWHLLLSQGIAFGIGMGFLFTGSVGVAPQWFVKKRSFANALATSGSGFGGLIYSLATNAMIKNIGLEWAFRILAIICFVVNGISATLIKDRNKHIGSVHVAFHKDLFKRIEVILLISWAFFSLIAYVIVIFSLTDYGQTVGFSASHASLLASMFSLSQGIGRPLIGLTSDYFGRLNIVCVGTFIAGFCALFLWIFAGKYFAGAIVYSLFGAFAGMIWATISPVGAEVVGIQLLPSLLSVTWIILVLPGTFAEVIGLSLRKHGVDGYLDVQLFTGFMFIAAGICSWLLRAWKLHELETMRLTKEQRELEIRDDDAVPRDPNERTTTTKGYLMYIMKGKGLFEWAHV